MIPNVIPKKFIKFNIKPINARAFTIGERSKGVVNLLFGNFPTEMGSLYRGDTIKIIRKSMVNIRKRKSVVFLPEKVKGVPKGIRNLIVVGNSSPKRI